MTAGPIIGVTLERIVNRDDAELVNFWEEIVPPITPPISRYGPLYEVSKSMFEGIWESCSKAEFVCFACATPFGYYSSEILALARRTADAGIRCYVLLPDPMPGNVNLSWLNGYRNRILVRAGKTAPMDFIVVEKGNHAGICFGSDPKVANQWTIDLTQAQCRGLFKLFLFMFWDDRNRENIFGSDFSPALPSPYRLVCPGPGEFGEITSREQEANVTFEKIVYDPYGSLLDTTFPKGVEIFSTAPSAESTKLLSLAKVDAANGRKILWRDLKLPLTIVSERAGCIYLLGDNANVQLPLEISQAEYLFSEIGACLKKPEWIFRTSGKVGRIQGAIIRAEAGNREKILDRQIINLESCEAHEISLMQKTEPNDWGAPSPIARTVLYKWEVFPPKVPVGAKKASLYQEWEQYDRSWSSLIETWEDTLNKVESFNNAPSSLTERLSVLFHGKDSSFADLKERIKSIRLLLPPSSLSSKKVEEELLPTLTQFESDAVNYMTSTRDNLQKINDAIDRDEQEKSYENEIGKIPVVIAEIEGKMNTLSLELAKHNSGLSLEPENSNKYGHESKQNKKKRKGIEGLKRQINELMTRKEGLLDKQKRGFVYKPTGRRHINFDFDQKFAAERTLRGRPEKELPTVGQLMEFNGKYYLSVKTYEEEDRAGKEAERFAAKLVAPQ